MNELIIEGKVEEIIIDNRATDSYAVGTYMWMGAVRKMIEFLRANVGHEIIISVKRKHLDPDPKDILYHKDTGIYKGTD